MDDFSLPRFLQELAEWEATASLREREVLDKVLAAMVMNPALPGRVPSFYDPLAPSYLYRSPTPVASLSLLRHEPGGTACIPGREGVKTRTRVPWVA